MEFLEKIDTKDIKPFFRRTFLSEHENLCSFVQIRVVPKDAIWRIRIHDCNTGIKLHGDLHTAEDYDLGIDRCARLGSLLLDFAAHLREEKAKRFTTIIKRTIITNDKQAFELFTEMTKSETIRKSNPGRIGWFKQGSGFIGFINTEEKLHTISIPNLDEVKKFLKGDRAMASSGAYIQIDDNKGIILKDE